MKNNTTLTEKQMEAIVKKYAPKKIHGNSKDSFYNCVRNCAYAFCGGKDKYNKDLYTMGKIAWMKAYNTIEYRSTLEDYDAKTDAVTLKAEKPHKTSRGSSKKTDNSLEFRVASLEKGQEEQKDILLKILAKLG